MSSEPSLLLLVAALLLTAAAAYRDLRTALIPNRLVAAFAVVLLSVRLWQGAAAAGGEGVLRALAAGVLGALATAAVPLVLYRFGGIGGGDVKLLAALGIALGPLYGIETELYAFAVMLLYAPVRLCYEGTLLRTLGASTALLMRPFMPAARRVAPAERPLTSFRFAPAVFVATLLTAALQVGGV